ncbi:hypothetical protein SNE25_20980 [Mucilaginibacter sabulilitoris]|uniref:Uncharacterized protein n=1 Tax=Mucilaginibacter sabulilitoris TaxID=1173583 RepID=A0ABZ0TKV8_9SPHI|nr:hypothetical protein [Mucilaginibacter sabulilitoris]WPU91795.1 hypothetical protein SNE25_20980 [Mucilaginibacter sabulilitoris]
MADYIQQETEKWFRSLIEPFRITGRDLVEKARAKTKLGGGFGNITWNLRSSIGYLIIYNGQVVETYFPTLETGAEGSDTGEKYAREIATLIDIHEGVQLVIVAGMEYAVLVERQGIEGQERKDVITHVVGDNIEAELRSILK